MKPCRQFLYIPTFLLMALVVSVAPTSRSQTPASKGNPPSNLGQFNPRGLDEVQLPKEGLVPDKETAIKIAEVVLFRLYGDKAIINQRPYKVKEEDYIWRISGTIKEDELGFAFSIAVSKQTAAILHLTLH